MVLHCYPRGVGDVCDQQAERKESEVFGERKDLVARPETERETDRNPTLLGGISDVSLEQVV